MDYTHDVFISYKRDPFRDDWLHEHFIPLFLHIVREEIAAECRRLPQGIFFDQTEMSKDSLKFDQAGIEPGDDWKQALRTALVHSRCMVALWSPLYFFSEWCQIEWRSFQQRSQVAGRSLIVPMSVHDGLAFPDDAKALQAPDFSDYVIVGAGFRETRAYPEFQRLLRVFAKSVARAVAASPAFQDFPIADVAPLPSEPVIPQQRL